MRANPVGLVMVIQGLETELVTWLVDGPIYQLSCSLR